jgi:hypothetical protein
LGKVAFHERDSLTSLRSTIRRQLGANPATPRLFVFEAIDGAAVPGRMESAVSVSIFQEATGKHATIVLRPEQPKPVRKFKSKRVPATIPTMQPTKPNYSTSRRGHRVPDRRTLREEGKARKQQREERAARSNARKLELECSSRFDHRRGMFDPLAEVLQRFGRAVIGRNRRRVLRSTLDGAATVLQTLVRRWNCRDGLVEQRDRRSEVLRLLEEMQWFEDEVAQGSHGQDEGDGSPSSPPAGTGRRLSVVDTQHLIRVNLSEIKAMDEQLHELRHPAGEVATGADVQDPALTDMQQNLAMSPTPEQQAASETPAADTDEPKPIYTRRRSQIMKKQMLQERVRQHMQKHKKAAAGFQTAIRAAATVRGEIEGTGGEAAQQGLGDSLRACSPVGAANAMRMLSGWQSVLTTTLRLQRLFRARRAIDQAKEVVQQKKAQNVMLILMPVMRARRRARKAREHRQATAEAAIVVQRNARMWHARWRVGRMRERELVCGSEMRTLGPC